MGVKNGATRVALLNSIKNKKVEIFDPVFTPVAIMNGKKFNRKTISNDLSQEFVTNDVDYYEMENKEEITAKVGKKKTRIE